MRVERGVESKRCVSDAVNDLEAMVGSARRIGDETVSSVSQNTIKDTVRT
jgi:hypothetical protein